MLGVSEKLKSSTLVEFRNEFLRITFIFWCIQANGRSKTLLHLDLLLVYTAPALDWYGINFLAYNFKILTFYSYSRQNFISYLKIQY